MQRLSVIIFRNTEGKILLQFRDSGAPSEPLGWSFFGGIAESDNETPTDAIIREVEEELNLNISDKDVRLLAEDHWVSPNSREEKMVYFFEGVNPLDWKHFAVKEGAGAAFLTKKEIAQMDSVSLLAKTLVAQYC